MIWLELVIISSGTLNLFLAVYLRRSISREVGWNSLVEKYKSAALLWRENAETAASEARAWKALWNGRNSL